MSEVLYWFYFLLGWYALLSCFLPAYFGLATYLRPKSGYLARSSRAYAAIILLPIVVLFVFVIWLYWSR